MENQTHRLWERIVASLEKRGLEIDPRLSPEKIACSLGGETGDLILRFVREFLYPRLYGEGAGGMAEEEAEALVRRVEDSAVIDHRSAGRDEEPTEEDPAPDAGEGEASAELTGDQERALDLWNLALDSVGVSRDRFDPPPSGSAIFCCERFEQSSERWLVRRAEFEEGDSGWTFQCDGGGHDHTSPDEFEMVPVEVMMERCPALFVYLALPRRFAIHVDENARFLGGLDDEERELAVVPGSFFDYEGKEYSSPPDEGSGASIDPVPVGNDPGTGWFRRLMVRIFCVALMTGVGHLSGCAGTTRPPTEHFREVAGGTCAYWTCEETAVSTDAVRVFGGPNGNSATYQERQLPLCAQHTRCAWLGRWPESSPNEALFGALFLGLIFGLGLASMVLGNPEQKS